MLKIIAITKKNDYYRIGESFNYSGWYATKEVQDTPVKNGDVVEITFEKEGKENVLKTIKVVGSAPTGDTTSSGNGGNSGGRSPDINTSIRKQSVGKMVAETVKAMDLKEASIEQVLIVIDTLYKKYEELTA